jgi:hypothetical protein
MNDIGLRKPHSVGLVGGNLQLAILEMVNGKWSAHHADTGEAGQQVDSSEMYISKFGEQQEPDAAADASQIDIDRELKP